LSGMATEKVPWQAHAATNKSFPLIFRGRANSSPERLLSNGSAVYRAAWDECRRIRIEGQYRFRRTYDELPAIFAAIRPDLVFDTHAQDLFNVSPDGFPDLSVAMLPDYAAD